MKEIISDESLVAFCGLYCGSCSRYLKEKCNGCAKNDKASWCKVRTCCLENGFSSCAECKDFDDISECKKFNNFMSKLFGFIFKSDRKACIEMIKTKGLEDYSEYMTENKIPSLKRT
ncbi:MAG: DUF3795 domain-containing protein [Desulfobacterales bacterium]|nr:DUF3795 domain-containing protein [Desulfobacterales bacterium]